jgi:hypothetical protein
VPQQSILLSALTPRESINFASKLRLPHDTTEEEHEANTERVLTVRWRRQKRPARRQSMKSSLNCVALDAVILHRPYRCTRVPTLALVMS